MGSPDKALLLEPVDNTGQCRLLLQTLLRQLANGHSTVWMQTGEYAPFRNRHAKRRNVSMEIVAGGGAGLGQKV